MKNDDDSAEYNRLADEIVRLVEEQKKILKTKSKPNTNSQFLRQYDATKTIGGTVFATLYTGGTLKTTHSDYNRLYNDFYTKDICNGVVLAITEICPNAIGVRCYFEFDYRSWVRLPTNEEMIEHVKESQKLVKEAFPNEKEDNVTCHVAKCSPKIKFAAESKKEKGKLALGIHLVFAQIVLNTTQLRQLILTLDARITAKTPFFSGSIDAASVHKESASLRPLYAYKLDRCDGCFTKKDKKVVVVTSTKKTTSNSKYLRNEKSWCGQELINLREDPVDCNYDSLSDNDDDNAAQLVVTNECKGEGCLKGRTLASPSIYEPWFILLKDGETIEYYDEDDEEEDENEKKKKWIQDMSIVPPSDLIKKFNVYNVPIDAVDTESLNVQNGMSSVVYKNEKSIFNSKAKTCIQFSHQSHFDLFVVVADAIRSFDPEHYADINVSDILFTQKSATMLVTLKGGKSCRFCVLRNDYHVSNRVFFFLSLKQKKKKKSEIRLLCHDPDCKKILDYYFKEKKEQQQNKNKNFLPFKECKLDLTYEQKINLPKTTKEIPNEFRKKLLLILNLKVKDILQEEDDNNNNKRFESFGSSNSKSGELMYSLPDGSCLPVPMFMDDRVGICVTKEELSLPLTTKKRNYEDQGYFIAGFEKDNKTTKYIQPKKDPVNVLELKMTFETLLDSAFED